MTPGPDGPWWTPRREGPRLGLWLTFLRGFGVEALAGLGLDWLGVDLQHGDVAATDLHDLLRAADADRLPVLVRLDGHDPAGVGRALDAGAAGVVVPAVESAAQAAALVDAARLPPGGRRSSGAGRRSLPTGGWRPDGEPLLLPMVETAAGLAVATEIAAVPGVDGLYVGPYDLSLSLQTGSTTSPGTLAAIAAVATAARERGLLAAAFAGDARLTEQLPELDLLAVDTDVAALRAGAAASLQHAREVARRAGSTG